MRLTAVIRLPDKGVILIFQVRGRPFDSEGGGGADTSIGTDYLFSSRARPENLFPGKSSRECVLRTPSVS